ncbi:hypothetical protein [Crassaminicella profunda]|uniref:hypothetical protein n=1 Tax=Crassaminicella profunda TaxID=1286698 RepID=UPI001CA7B002|nr:hypothetical protein [Crassaminicella profunda]QZY55424.1 hypothetical protein K7H06_20910 [Crassaminicella profunda]
MKKKVSLILVFTLVLSIFCIQGYAYGSKKFVPPGLAKKGGLPPGLAKKETLPPGWANKVNPSEEEEIIEETGLTGIVKEVDENTLKIKMNTGLFILEIENSTIIKINGEAVSLDHIDVGDEINIKIHDQNNLIEIDRANQKRTQFVTGKLLWIENEEKIAIKANEDIKTYKIAENVKVYIHDQLKTLGDLKENEIIKVRVEDDKITFIKWNPSVLVEDIIFKGTIHTIDQDEKEIVVKNQHAIKLFKIHDDTMIKIDGDEETFNYLEKGMIVQVFFEEDKVVKILAEKLENRYEGKLIKIQSGLHHEITIELKDETKDFIIDEDVEIENEDGEEIDFVELFDKIKSQVKIKTENNKVVFIEVEE